MPDTMPEFMSDRMPDRMSESMSDRLPDRTDRMLEYMPDRRQNICQINCLNI